MEKMEDIKKILCINFGGIGDEILFLPTILSLKKEFPDAKITLALEPRSKGIKSLTNKIDDLFLVDIKNGNKYIGHIFRAIIENGEPYVDGLEHSEILWMDIREYEKYPLAPNVRDFCKRYLNKEFNV